MPFGTLLFGVCFGRKVLPFAFSGRRSGPARCALTTVSGITPNKSKPSMAWKIHQKERSFNEEDEISKNDGFRARVFDFV